MASNGISRRELIAVAAAIANARPLAAQNESATISSGEVIARIRNNVGIPWREQTVDNIIAGSADTPVHGIATTMMATLDVMKRAAAVGKNMVITHEPTFYSHQDNIDQFKDDPVYRFKSEFIREHNVVSFHFHDHWPRRSPDGIALGMARELGWEKYADPDNLRVFTIPQTKFGAACEGHPVETEAADDASSGRPATFD